MAATTTQLKNQRVFKGSGDMYTLKYDSSDSSAVKFPELEIDPKTKTVVISDDNETAIFAALKAIYGDGEENRLGALKGGYKYTENLELLEDQDDLGYITVSEIVKETAVNEFALFNANGETIKKMHPLASSGTSKSGMRVTPIGGLNNKNDDEHYLMFVHKDTMNGDIVLLTRGKNVSGLEIAFDASNVSPLNCKYNAQSLDSKGTLIYIFELPKNFDWKTGTVKAAS